MCTKEIGFPAGKKSYALSFILRDDEKNAKRYDNRQEHAMAIRCFGREAGAVIR
jgi:phenylalanyl-tRNA synthetase beta subunit